MSHQPIQQQSRGQGKQKTQADPTCLISSHPSASCPGRAGGQDWKQCREVPPAVGFTHAQSTHVDLNLGQVLWGDHQYWSHKSASARAEGSPPWKRPKQKVISLKGLVEIGTEAKEMTGQSLIMGVFILTAKQSFWGNEINFFQASLFPIVKWIYLFYKVCED